MSNCPKKVRNKLRSFSKGQLMMKSEKETKKMKLNNGVSVFKYVFSIFMDNLPEILQVKAAYRTIFEQH